MTDYPELITVDGKDYEINTDFRYGLACYQCINDKEISDTDIIEPIRSDCVNFFFVSCIGVNFFWN